MSPLPDNAVDQFVNTFKEWHYFVNGLALGFLSGFLIALYFLKDAFEE